MTTENVTITSRRIKQLREEQGLTQEKLSTEIHISRDVLGRYETDRTVPTDNLIRIAKYFKTTTDYLLGLTNSKSIEEDNQVISNKIGFDDEDIKILEHLKIYRPEVLETIRFLIKQEEDNAPTGPNLDTKKAHKLYEKELENYEKTHSPVLSTISNYFNTEIPKEEEKFFINNELKNYIDISKSGVISTNEILNKTFLEEITQKLKNAKNIKRKENKK